MVHISHESEANKRVQRSEKNIRVREKTERERAECLFRGSEESAVEPHSCDGEGD